MLRQLLEAPVAANFMRLSCQFAEQVGLETQKVRAVLDAADKAGVMCSMPMFGEAVFTITEQENLRRVLQVFSNHCSSGTTIVCGINQDGARVLQ